MTRETELQNTNQWDFSSWIYHKMVYSETEKSPEIIAGVKRSKRESKLLCPIQTPKEATVPQAHMRALDSIIRNSFIEIKEEKLAQLTSHFKRAPKHMQEDNLHKQDKQRMGDRKITNFIKHDGKWWIKTDRLTQGHTKSARSQVH